MRILQPYVLFGALILCVVSLGACFLSPEPKTDWFLQTRADYMEMMHEDTNEYPRIHHTDSFGNDLWIALRYKNGESGKLTMGPEGKLSLAEYYFADGSLRKTMRFDKDGKTLFEGHELHNDRSLFWKTESVNRDTYTVTTIYWPGGVTPFSVIEENRTHAMKTVKYFRQSGVLHVETLQTAAGQVLSQKTYDERGTIRSALTAGTGVAEVDYFRPNGKLEFKQVYEAYEYTRDLPDGKPFASVARFLRKVLIVGDDGDTVMRVLTMSAGLNPFVQMELKPNDDGTRTRYNLDNDGVVLSAKRLDKSNKQIPNVVEEKGPPRKFDAGLTAQPNVETERAIATWKAAQSKSGYSQEAN